MSQDSDDDKPYEATQKRLDDARARGEGPKSQDLTAAAGYAGLLLVLIAFGTPMLSHSGAALSSLLAEADRLPLRLPLGAFTALLLPLLPLFLVPAALALAMLALQRAFVVAPEKLAPRLSRISPLAIAGQRFGASGLFDFARNLGKLVLVSLLLWVLVQDALPDVLGAMALEPAPGLSIMLGLAFRFLAAVVVLTLVLGIADYVFQWFSHLRRLRMSRREMLDEMRDSEGDPQFKMQRRRRGTQIAMKQMMADVAKADVVIVNPTHYAVALRWDRAARRAPVCVAKGMDEVAARIRAAAAEAAVPLRRDPPTARMLFAEVAVGEEILPAHYRAVAAAIRFAESIRNRAKWRRT